MPEVTQQSGEADNLPAKVSPYDRHRNHIAADLHPSIEMDDEYWKLRREGPRNGQLFDDGDKLIGFMKRNRCPVCGETGTLSLTKAVSYTFKKGVETRAKSDETESGWKQNEAVKRLEDEGYRPLSCRAPGGHYDFVIGIVTPSAYEEWREWKDTKRKRESFKSTARSLANKYDDPEYIYWDNRTSYSHGVLLAAIYEALGSVSYDERDLMDRDHVRKDHLYAILERIKTLEWRESKAVDGETWMIQQDFGVKAGMVEWHKPEWVDFDGLNYSDYYQTKVFE